MGNNSQIVVFEQTGFNVVIKAKLFNDSIWLTQEQIADLFGTQRPAITKHLGNIFTSGELIKNTVCSKMEQTATDGKTYKTNFYNLDAVISVGYRVNSKLATQFRIWATQVLRDHILKGYSINRHRLPDISWDEFDQTVAMVKAASKKKLLPTAESMALLDIIARYTKSFVLLQQIDSNTLPEVVLLTQAKVELDYKNFERAIVQLKSTLISQGQASAIFGTQRGDGFNRVIGSIYQTFDGKDLYPSIEEKASHLLYFIIKDHPFVDGNKRIGSLLFVWFLETNLYLRKKTGETKINDNALVTLALLVAESKPTDKELMIRLIMHLLHEN